ncbi:MAG TPA: hypothetical protein VH000_12950 [Rhizomicrobium sp.]|jgi:hypothetical protein|nr:hypothetical protein [Rhizomicrobium sp.]
MTQKTPPPKFGFWSRAAALVIFAAAIFVIVMIIAGADHLIDNGPDSRPLPALFYGALGLFALGSYFAQVRNNIPGDWDALKATNWLLVPVGLMLLAAALVVDRVIQLPCFAVAFGAC